jgi:hypothetical protein
MLKLAPGVKCNGLKPEILLGIHITHAIFQQYGQEMLIISVVDGMHDGGPFSTSSHYSGQAFDVLKPSSDLLEGMYADMKVALGEQYHVYLHQTQDHIHVAFLPKRPAD